MLGGRNMLGQLLFKDASIALHKIEKISNSKLMTRWTLRVTIKVLPWSPTARFTGVSYYTLNTEGKVILQEDYWDSINLSGGEYKQVPVMDGLSDFLGQIKQESGAEMAAPELPYELLRRAARYEVRRYPAFVAAEVIYDQRPEGYDRLGSYVSGSNTQSSRFPYFSPTLMRVTYASSGRSKVMRWPLVYQMPNSDISPSISALPEPTLDMVSLAVQPTMVVAVSRYILCIYYINRGPY